MLLDVTQWVISFMVENFISYVHVDFQLNKKQKYMMDLKSNALALHLLK